MGAPIVLKMTKNVFTFFIRECLITRHNLFLIGLCASYYRTHVPFSAYVTKRSVRIWWILIRHFFLFREYRKQDWTLYWKMLFWFFYWSLLSYNVKQTFISFLNCNTFLIISWFHSGRTIIVNVYLHYLRRRFGIIRA